MFPTRGDAQQRGSCVCIQRVYRGVLARRQFSELFFGMISEELNVPDGEGSPPTSPQRGMAPNSTSLEEALEEAGRPDRYDDRTALPAMGFFAPSTLSEDNPLDQGSAHDDQHLPAAASAEPELTEEGMAGMSIDTLHGVRR